MINLLCPPGALQYGQPPPNDTKLYCRIQTESGEVQYHGPFIEYYLYGNKQLSGEFDHNRRKGTWFYWTEDGKMEKEERYDNNVLLYRKESAESEHHLEITQYKITEFYPSGRQKSAGLLKNNLKHERWQEWDESGNLASQIDYREGKIDGWKILYFPNGRKKSEQRYSNDLPEGKYSEWNEAGQQTVEGYYRDGLKQGTWKKWGADGKLVEQTEWWKGAPTPASPSPHL